MQHVLNYVFIFKLLGRATSFDLWKLQLKWGGIIPSTLKYAWLKVSKFSHRCRYAEILAWMRQRNQLYMNLRGLRFWTQNTSRTLQHCLNGESISNHLLPVTYHPFRRSSKCYHKWCRRVPCRSDPRLGIIGGQDVTDQHFDGPGRLLCSPQKLHPEASSSHQGLQK